jgi:hypothetical protein
MGPAIQVFPLSCCDLVGIYGGWLHMIIPPDERETSAKPRRDEKLLVSRQAKRPGKDLFNR